MQYRKMGSSDLNVSVIAQGTWAMGNDFFGEVGESDAIKTIHASIDAGVNLVDTAPAYGQDGESEKVVGKALKGRRDRVILATKFGVLRFGGHYVRTLEPAIMREELELSLRRLQTDYIDLYLVHWPDYNNGIEGALHELVKVKKEGKIREIGVSNFSVSEIKMAREIAGIVAVQPPLNMLNRSSFDNGIMSYCADNGIGIMTYGSLGGGILTGKMEKPVAGGKENRGAFYSFYEEPMWSKCQELLAVLSKIAKERNVSVAEVSINWVLGQTGVTTALLGATTPDMAAENARAAQWSLTGAELSEIEKNYKRIMG